MRGLRAAIPEAKRAAAADKIRDVFLSQIPLPPHSIIAGYWPIHHEIDPRPLMTALHQRGHRLCLPVVTGAAQNLIFRGYTPGDTLADTPLGTAEPLPHAPILVPDILLVPGLAFTQNGHRLGYGGGYYDRTLADLRAQKDIMAVGLGYAAQILPGLPQENGDEKLTRIITAP